VQSLRLAPAGPQLTTRTTQTLSPPSPNGWPGSE